MSFKIVLWVLEMFKNEKSQMSLGLGYNECVAAKSIKILLKLLSQHVKNALGHCHDGRGFYD